MNYHREVLPFKSKRPRNMPRSYEPTLSGFSDMSGQYQKQHEVIIPANTHQRNVFRAIEDINPIDLEPRGPLSNRRDPRTWRYWWLRRTPEGINPVIWCRKTNTMCDVTIEVTFSDGFYLSVHVPMDSWNNQTCDPEAVRAAIQQCYINVINNVKEVVVVKPGMRSSRTAGTSHRDYSPDNVSRSSGSTTLHGTPPLVGLTQVPRGQRRGSYYTHATPIMPVPQYANMYGYSLPYRAPQEAPLTHYSSRTLVEQDDSRSYYSLSASTLVTPSIDTWDERPRHYHVPPPQRSEPHTSIISYSHGSSSGGSSDSVRKDRGSSPSTLKKRKGW